MTGPKVKPSRADRYKAEMPSTELEARAAAFCGLTPRRVESAVQGGMVEPVAAMFGTEAALIWRLSHRWLE